MSNDYEIIRWNDLRNKLSEMYPHLTHADLSWRHSSIDDLLEMIACKLGKSERELWAIMNEP